MSLLAAPQVEFSIFSKISQLSRKHEAINLGQGFPDFAPDEDLVARLMYHTQHSSNQYAPMAGVSSLLKAIAVKTKRTQDVELDVAHEITVTSGATQGLWTAIQSVLRAGDEAIVFEPAYDSYAPAIRSKGARVIPCPLRDADYRPDWSRFADSLTARTKLVVINNPHNPTGTCWRADDLEELSQHLRDRDIILLSDEVYEHLTYDEQPHLSVLRYPELRKRAFITSSFGKTFHVTGWKVGYVVAPPALTTRFRGLHQYTVFSVNAPAQRAIADHLHDSDTYLSLPRFFEAKRNFLRDALATSRFRWVGSAGSYFSLVDYSAISREPDTRFAERLITEVGVAAIPISPFYTDLVESRYVVRLCFAKQEATLRAAADRLVRF